MKNIAFLTSGGIAPCLSSCIVRLMFQYKKKFDNVNFVGYLNGYKGLLTNNKIFLNLQIKIKVRVFMNLEVV